MSRWRGAWLAAALLLALKGVFALIPGMWAWGLNVQRFLDPVSGWGLWACAALLLVPPLARPLGPALEALGTFLARSRHATWVAGITAALLVFALPDRVWFTGDFVLRQGSIPSDLSGGYQYALPLDVLLHRELPRLLGITSVGGANLALRVLGALEAGVLGVFAVLLGRALSTHAIAVAVVAGVVFLGGHLTLYTGLGKPAAEICLAVLGLAAYGVRALRGASSLLPAGLCVAAAIALHRAGLLLIPAFAVIAWSRLRNPPGAVPGDRALSLLAVLVPAGVALSVAPAVMRAITDWDIPHHLPSGGALIAVPFSGRRLLDLLNLMLALAPLFPVLLLWAPGAWRRLRSREALAIGMLALAFVPVVLWVQPSQGIFRDWDVFAPAAVALSVLVAYLLVSKQEPPGDPALAVAILAFVFVVSFQWLALNHDRARGLQRVRAYLLEAPGPAEGNAHVIWDFLATRHMSEGDWNDAADAARRASALAPLRRHLLTWGLTETMRGEYAGAAAAYRQVIAQDTTDLIGWVGLAGAARRGGDTATLDTALAVIRERPHSAARLAELRQFLEHFPVIWPMDSAGVTGAPR